VRVVDQLGRSIGQLSGRDHNECECDPALETVEEHQWRVLDEIREAQPRPRALRLADLDRPRQPRRAHSPQSLVEVVLADDEPLRKELSHGKRYRIDSRPAEDEAGARQRAAALECMEAGIPP